MKSLLRLLLLISVMIPALLIPGCSDMLATEAELEDLDALIRSLPVEPVLIYDKKDLLAIYGDLGGYYMPDDAMTEKALARHGRLSEPIELLIDVQAV